MSLQKFLYCLSILLMHFRIGSFKRSSGNSDMSPPDALSSGVADEDTTASRFVWPTIGDYNRRAKGCASESSSGGLHRKVHPRSSGRAIGGSASVHIYPTGASMPLPLLCIIWTDDEGHEAFALSQVVPDNSTNIFNWISTCSSTRFKL